MKKFALSLLLLTTVAAIGCSHYQKPRPQPVPFSEATRASFDALRDCVVQGANDYAQVLSTEQGGGDAPPLNRFTLSVTDGGDQMEIIEMEPIIVIGDLSAGCAKDPPGISCVCPCP